MQTPGFARNDKIWTLVARALEPVAQSLPALEVLMIEFGSLERKLRRLTHKASLEHEGQRVLHVHRLQFGLARLLKRFRVGTVTRHAIVQAGATWHESLRLGVIFTMDQPHELVHEVAMKPGRTKRMLRNHPSRRKNREVNIGGPENLRRRRQHRVNRRIGMV